MHVGQVMIRDVETVSPDTPMIAAARRMRDRRIGLLVVVEAGRPVGVISDRDIVVRALAEGAYHDHLPVRKAMSIELVSCRQDQPLQEAEQLMAEHGVNRLPVLDSKGALVGILSRRDLPGASVSRRPYRVTFYRHLVGTAGQPSNVPLRSFYISGCPSAEAAVAAAIPRFQAEHGGRPWSSMADGYDVTKPD